ncbi:MAG: shikimate kinase AroK [Gammaproteobacteria bacterium]|nr:shikimate kinase AroK [Gammaproteobacteria bacterium]MBT8438046.1 shikimate kinase AroK [Gammaproteobacteria bacterium]
MSHRNIILIGPMGSGKSTIGNIIAKRLHREFEDSDHFIEQRTGVDIARIFDIEGEQGFRDRESSALSELLSTNNRVIATGGGSIMRSENQQLLKQKGYIVFLDTSVNQQLYRLRRDKKRPLLQTENPRERLESLSAERRPIYLDLADLAVKTDKRMARRLAADIINQLPDNLK